MAEIPTNTASSGTETLAQPEIPQFDPSVKVAELQTTLQTLPPEDQVPFMLRILQDVCIGPGKCTLETTTQFTDKIDVTALPLSPEDQRQIQYALNGLIKIKNLPLIHDGFGQFHGDIEKKTGRRGWRWFMKNQYFGQPFVEAYERHNKLRWQLLGAAWGYASMLLMILKGYPELESLTAAVQTFQTTFQREVHENLADKERLEGESYIHQFTPEQRRVAALAIDQALGELLVTFAALLTGSQPFLNLPFDTRLKFGKL